MYVFKKYFGTSKISILKKWVFNLNGPPFCFLGYHFKSCVQTSELSAYFCLNDAQTFDKFLKVGRRLLRWNFQINVFEIVE